MLKMISAALLAVSVLAAPAMAAGSGKLTQAPASKQAVVAKTAQAKPSVLNANAKMGHHRKHVRHHRSHKHMGVIKTHKVSKVTTKHIAPATRRG
ncbi:MAG: hypothetical protein NVS2B1_00240 [Bradyrhizobium sp.]